MVDQFKSLVDELARVDEGKSNLLKAQFARAVAQERQTLQQFEVLLQGGNPEHGQAVFFGKKAACSTCHRIDGQGGAIGPDLSRVGAIRSGRDLLESIIVPGSTFAQGYENYLVVTKEGQVFSGVMARQDTWAIVLRDSSGTERLVPRDSIDQMRLSRTSLMPEGLDKVLTHEELHDLVAFLLSLK